MQYKGNLRKMSVENANPVSYWLNLNKERTAKLNDLIGSEISLKWTGKINCINCGKSIKKTYGQGFCYTCFTEAPSAAPCIVRPEICEAHLGKGRDPKWEEEHHNKPHKVYLAQTSAVKVGVTRSSQVPTRWIDQGAWRAIVIAETPYRALAGMLEVELKQYISDRTDWRKMLIDERGDENIADMVAELCSFLPEDLSKYCVNERVMTFDYPVSDYPQKVKSIKLETVKEIKEKLTGIRGQYLYFNQSNVINLRKYSGYEVELNA